MSTNGIVTKRKPVPSVVAVFGAERAVVLTVVPTAHGAVDKQLVVGADVAALWTVVAFGVDGDAFKFDKWAVTNSFWFGWFGHVNLL